MGWKLVSTYFLLSLILLALILNSVFNSYLSHHITLKTDEKIQKSQIISNIIKYKYYVLKRIDSKIDNYGFISDVKFSDEHRVLIVDTDNKVVIDSFNILFNHKVKSEDINPLKKTFVAKSKVYKHKDERFLYTYTPIVRDNIYLGTVLVISKINYIYKAAYGIVFQMVNIALLFTLIYGIILFLYFSKVFSPIDKLKDGVLKMAKGDYSYKIKPIGLKEFKKIAFSFNEMSNRLNEVEKKQNTFVSNVSHELKTPISSIKIMSDNILTSYKDMNEDILKEFLSDISHETDRLHEIIDDLLYLASIEKNQVSISIENRPFIKAIERAVQTILPIAAERNIKISYDESVKIFVDFDYKKIIQVLINLLSNAIKYNKIGGEVEILQIDSKKDIQIHVKDTGIGIPKEEIPYIFNRFYRVSSSRTRQTGGTGLGTSIVKNIVELHRGTVEVKSKVDKGTTIIITLPKKFEV